MKTLKIDLTKEALADMPGPVFSKESTARMPPVYTGTQEDEDIVKVLRGWVGPDAPLDEAADEIERLTAALDAETERCAQAAYDYMAKAVDSEIWPPYALGVWEAIRGEKT